MRLCGLPRPGRREVDAAAATSAAVVVAEQSLRAGHVYWAVWLPVGLHTRRAAAAARWAWCKLLGDAMFVPAALPAVSSCEFSKGQSTRADCLPLLPKSAQKSRDCHKAERRVCIVALQLRGKKKRRRAAAMMVEQ